MERFKEVPLVELEEGDRFHFAGKRKPYQVVEKTTEGKAPYSITKVRVKADAETYPRTVKKSELSELVIFLRNAHG